MHGRMMAEYGPETRASTCAKRSIERRRKPERETLKSQVTPLEVRMRNVQPFPSSENVYDRNARRLKNRRECLEFAFGSWLPPYALMDSLRSHSQKLKIP